MFNLYFHLHYVSIINYAFISWYLAPVVIDFVNVAMEHIILMIIF